MYKSMNPIRVVDVLRAPGVKILKRRASIFDDVFMSEARQREIIFKVDPPVDMLLVAKSWQVQTDQDYGGTSALSVYRGEFFLVECITFNTL